MDTKDIGNIGEHLAIVELLNKGIIVSRPLGDSAKYDLVIDINDVLYTCQVKTTTKLVNGCAQFYLKTASVRSGSRNVGYDVDLFILVELSTKMVCILPNTTERSTIWIRPVRDTVSNKGMNFAEDLSIDKFIENNNW